MLILDGLSLRELPWLLQGAKERGFTTHGVAACASELPGETDEFARALGFASRSKLQRFNLILHLAIIRTIFRLAGADNHQHGLGVGVVDGLSTATEGL